MKKLRLLLREECDRSCKGCCNKDWSLSDLPIATDFRGYDLIMLTGGEPMLDAKHVIDTANRIRDVNFTTEIVLYTAKTNRPLELIGLLVFLDGVTITLHEQKDVKLFDEFNQLYMNTGIPYCPRNHRLNVFCGVDISGIDTEGWQVKKDIEWIKNCPLPEDEQFLRLQS